VKLKKLNLKSTSITIRVPALSETTFPHNWSHNETKKLTEDCTQNQNLITSQNQTFLNSSFSSIEDLKSQTPLVKKETAKYKKKMVIWESPLLKFGLPIVLVERLNLKNMSTNIIEGSLPTQISSIDKLPLPPNFNFKYLEFENDDIGAGASNLQSEKKRVSNTKATLQMYPNDPLLVGVTDSNAWVHKTINAQGIHTELSTVHPLKTQQGEEGNVYEILDSRTITIECMNESASDEEEEGYEIKKKNEGSIGDTNRRRNANFNRILNLDGLK